MKKGGKSLQKRIEDKVIEIIDKSGVKNQELLSMVSPTLVEELYSVVPCIIRTRICCSLTF